MTEQRLYTIALEPVGRRIRVPEGSNLLDTARSAGVELDAICGGVGACAGCRVRLVGGTLAPPTLTEQAELGAAALAAGERLACQAIICDDARIDLPPSSLTAAQRLQLDGQGVLAPTDPSLVAVDIQLDPPGLGDHRSDTTRLADALARRGYNTSELIAGRAALADLPGRLRAGGWGGRALLRATAGATELVGLLPCSSPLLGLAVDAGTTKLAAYLIDLENGAIVARLGAMNPQIAYGEDVVSRIAYAAQGEQQRETLRSRLVDTIDALAGSLVEQAGAERAQIGEAVIVGNTVIHHLLLGLPVHQLGEAPYVPATAMALDLPASDLGLHLAPGAHLYLPPLIAGYVGADHIAMVLACGLQNERRNILAIDIGTNTEVTLVHRGRLRSCSCASGPAFEGAHIEDGMRAAPGAIERVHQAGELLRVTTIGDHGPIGICGSGILDAVAALRATGVLDSRGTLDPTRPGVTGNGRQAAYMLVPAEQSGHGRAIRVTRGDVREIQLAKAAIRAGIEVLLAEAGLTAGMLDEVLIAGAFGSYLDLDSAIRIGLLPSLPRERFRQIGNAAGMGAVALLCSRSRRSAAAELATRIDYVELTTYPGFSDIFVDALTLEPR